MTNKPTAFQHRSAPSLTEEVVRNVVSEFYSRVRKDDVLGPVFEDAIGSNWDEHLQRIAQFWLTATRLGRGYDGSRFMPAHLRHSSVRAEQLPRWLALFRQTVAEQCMPEAAELLLDIAERMAETLALGLARRDQTNAAGQP